MGWYGTLLLAKPAEGTLPACQGVRQAFGSRFVTPSVMPMFGNRLGLHDLGGGWQRVGVRLFNRERLRLAAGVQELAAVTAAPVLAGWVSESSCVHLEARTPAGVAVSVHLPNTDENCGYQHLDGRPGRVEPHSAVEAFEAWAHEAGRTPVPETISAVVHGTWDESPFREDTVLALFAALGYPSEREVLPVVDPHDPAFGDYDLWSHFADISAGGLILAAEKGWVLGPEHDVTPMEQDYLRFEDLVWGSVYGGGLSRDELIAEYEQLKSRWPDPQSSRRRRD
ncbi:hypothetical protein KZZ52_34270 [Dactylosporangium sp. AC04546]|uniref:hypothetical protein n=1 Tax=Dactylosporangium sp. AC04546 TaxID=2862460 RepID=UPI001EDF4E71|nr:hypothetical protein [Dactylosporangium sp. AC04546]WVK79039.1 hypothetical protein KZZ52_34270 [Dactylosporangium sp. AC04546]